MIIVDFNPIIIASVSVAQNNVAPEEIDIKFIRHLFLNSIVSYRKKFAEKYGDDIIIACDSGDVWRKKEFPYYKAGRKQAKADSPVMWDMVYESLETIRNELIEYFPYKVIKVNGAEADDIIGVLCKYFQDNELIQKGLEEEPQKIMIVSNDKDFKQLQKFPNVYQYSPMFNKMIAEKDPKRFVMEQFIYGDKGDGIPNFLSDDDTFVTGKRQKSVYTEKVENWVNMTFEQIANGDKRLLANLNRNKKLIDLCAIPENVETEIINKYKSATVNPRSKLFGYFMQNQLKNLVKDINNF